LDERLIFVVTGRWEFHITESNRDYWRVQSLVPPEVGSEALKTWVEAGKGVPWEGMEKL
jgi:hypothetical protein